MKKNIIVESVNLYKKFKLPKTYAQLLRHPLKTEEVIALERIDFSVPQGSCLGILGPNGAGKTTLMKILSTLIRPTGGEVWINGINVEENPDEVKKVIGCVVNDERSFFWRLTGRQNLHFFATLNNIPKRKAAAAIDRLAQLVDLTRDIEKPFQNYSSGMKQKLAIIRALLTDPKILLFDEPSKNLDPLFRSKLLMFLKETILGEMKATIIMATHDIQEAEHLCDNIMLLDRGKVVLHDAMNAKLNIQDIFNKLIKWERHAGP